MSEAAETDRTTVKTYVPAYQKREWVEHAEELDMSQSEFVRTMVQAGRRGFGASDPEETGSDGANPGGTGLEDRLLGVLSAEEPKDWEELLEAVTDDIEERVDEALTELQEANRVHHSGRHGGYLLADGD